MAHVMADVNKGQLKADRPTIRPPCGWRPSLRSTYRPHGDNIGISATDHELNRP